ncbi:MAG: hypothetical protein R8M45_09765 [Ghiorsea sp.]
MQINLRLLALILLVTGCGLKTDVVAYDDAPMPSISQLAHQQRDMEISFELDIQGGSGAVVYQIDRAVIEADCKCIGGWLRYYESSPSNKRLGLQRHIKLRPQKHYAFRLRAMDSLGRKSVWGNIIRTDRKEVGNNHE